MGCSQSGASRALPKPDDVPATIIHFSRGVTMQTSQLLRPVRLPAPPNSAEPGKEVEVSPDKIGVEAPTIPGDIALCGSLSREAALAVGDRFQTWINLNGADDKGFWPEELESAGVKNVEVRLFPGPPMMPSEQNVADGLKALDTLPRPLMLQCTSGNRAGVLLLLWLLKNKGYSVESAKQLAEDNDLKFWQRCQDCGPMREWLIERLPKSDRKSISRPAEGLVFSQLFDPDSSTFTYLLGCEVTKQAVLIDPVIEQKRRDMEMLTEHGLDLRYVVSTHMHSDHVTAAGRIRSELADVRTVISRNAGAKADLLVGAGDKVPFGKFALEAIPTPGHTDGCVSWLLHGCPGQPGMVFTGDTLLIRGCGRTDLQSGDAAQLYDSVHEKLFTLPRDTVVYPGHDGCGRNMSSIAEEKKFNPRFTKSKAEFVEEMANLRLPIPSQMDKVLPANRICGLQDCSHEVVHRV